MSKHYVALLVLSVLLLAASPAAAALGKVSSPRVVKGELEVEYAGTRTFDGQRAKDNLQKHAVSISYAVTDWWAPEITGVFKNSATESTELVAYEFENSFQLTETGKYWLDVGLKVAYVHADDRRTADALEAKLLLEKQDGRFVHRANIGTEQEVGPNAGGGGPEWSFRWGSRYLYDRHFAPGLELQSEFGQGSQGLGFNEQKHYAGPGLYGQIIPGVKYEVAYLFGVSDAAATGAARWFLEFETFF